MNKILLYIGATIMFLLAIGHIACLFFLQKAFEVYGIAEKMSRFSDPQLYLITIVVIMFFVISGLYALSANGDIKKLPLTKVAISVICALLFGRVIWGLGLLITNYTRLELSSTLGAALLLGCFVQGLKKRSAMETKRIYLRKWRKSDAESLFKYASDPEIGTRAGWPPHKNIEESQNIINTIFNNDNTWAIVLKNTNEAIGSIGYFPFGKSNITIGKNDCEIGYWIGKPYWNQGICTEAMQLLIDYCFNEKHFDTIWSDHFIENPASGRVMEKCGFVMNNYDYINPNLFYKEKQKVRVLKLESNNYKNRI